MPEGFDETAEAGGEDRIGALPDELLQHVLSFLASREAVWTCVLARRWRHQWKSVPALRITDVHTYESAQHLNKFVNYLIVLRYRSPLHECDIMSYFGEGGDERFRYTELWIRYALSCQVRVLRVHNFAPDQYFELPNTPLFSRHLTRLQLEGVELMFCSLNFSSCPALETLKMNGCSFAADDISAPSLQWLSITYCDFGGSNRNTRTLISVPSLVYLELDSSSGRVPCLNSMPSLVSAHVILDDSSDDVCDNGDYNGCDDDRCHACYGLDDDDGRVLLDNLSGATNLELISDPEVFIFRKDLKWSPTFSKLKTLLLNEWCVEPQFGALVYFLQHSPILEKLTLQLNKTQQPVAETDEGYNPTEKFLVSKHLRVVEIKCQKEDEWVHKIIKILNTYGVPPEQINIQKNFWYSESFTSDSEQSDSEQLDSERSDCEQLIRSSRIKIWGIDDSTIS